MEWNCVLRLSCVFNIPIKLGFNFMGSDARFRCNDCIRKNDIKLKYCINS
jgi:hypothetical protein